MNRPRNKSSGFTLLEMIIVLAIAGVVLTFYAVYAKKEADRTARENITTALVQEIKGVMALILDTDADPDGNPFYLDKAEDAYHRRITNKENDKDTGSKSNYFLWGDGKSSAEQQRYYFISKDCKSSTLKSKYAFDKGYLPCMLSNVAKNNNVIIDRVGFYAPSGDSTSGSSEDKYAINRTDIIIAFKSDTDKEKLTFAEYYPQFSKALSNAGLAISRAVVVYRNSSSENWKVVMHSKDDTQPVEFADVGNNMGALDAHSAGQFGVRFSFNMSDNDSSNGSGGGGGASMCWDANNSQATMCLEKEEGTGNHGEDKVVALNMEEKSNPASQRLGTMATNVVMENTSRRVYIFRRREGNLYPSTESPERIIYTDPNDSSLTYNGDLTFDDQAIYDQIPGVDFDQNLADDYLSKTWDAFELVTPPVIDYVSNSSTGNPIDGSDYKPTYQDGTAYYDDGNEPKSFRFPVQTCPMVNQKIALRDRDGNPITDGDGKVQYKEVQRYLFPRLSVAISSIAAYNGNQYTDLTDPSRTRTNMNSNLKVGQLGGLTVQINFAEQNTNSGTSCVNGSCNQASHLIYEDHKYIWVVSSILGVYDPDSGKGANIISPTSVSYVVTRWCSTVPQSGTPADLLQSNVYK